MGPEFDDVMIDHFQIMTLHDLKFKMNFFISHPQSNTSRIMHVKYYFLLENTKKKRRKNFLKKRVETSVTASSV